MNQKQIDEELLQKEKEAIARMDALFKKKFRNAEQMRQQELKKKVTDDTLENNIQ